MYNVNAYYDLIYDFITIYNYLEMALSSLIYIINDVIMCSDVSIFPLFISQHKFHFFSYNLRHKWRLSVEDRRSYYIL